MGRRTSESESRTSSTTKCAQSRRSSRRSAREPALEGSHSSPPSKADDEVALSCAQCLCSPSPSTFLLVVLGWSLTDCGQAFVSNRSSYTSSAHIALAQTSFVGLGDAQPALLRRACQVRRRSLCLVCLLRI